VAGVNPLLSPPPRPPRELVAAAYRHHRRVRRTLLLGETTALFCLSAVRGADNGTWPWAVGYILLLSLVCVLAMAYGIAHERAEQSSALLASIDLYRAAARVDHRNGGPARPGPVVDV